jgi:hypothetical protein
MLCSRFQGFFALADGTLRVRTPDILASDDRVGVLGMFCGDR